MSAHDSRLQVPPVSAPATVAVFASPNSWIESDALVQCRQVAALDGMIHVAGMPDLHPGKGAPIGAAMTSRLLYPLLVGSDIGCGIAVFPIALKRAVPDKLAARFPNLDQPLDPVRDGDDPAWTAVAGDIPAGHLDGLGTVGRGNHFVELARVDTVTDPGRAGQLSLAAGDLVLIVHSGSRGLGERILRTHTQVHGAGPAPDPAGYLAAHDQAVRWGSLNRRLLAARVAHALGAEPAEPMVEVCHNQVEVRDGVYLHRKGAAQGEPERVLRKQGRQEVAGGAQLASEAGQALEKIRRGHGELWLFVDHDGEAGVGEGTGEARPFIANLADGFG